MGDRISFSFKNGEEESVAFFSHWDGRSLEGTVNTYIAHLRRKLAENDPEGTSMGYPIERFEPNTVMLDFIRWFTRNMELITSNYYLGKDENDGDNSDNGHFVIDLTPYCKAKEKKAGRKGGETK